MLNIQHGSPPSPCLILWFISLLWARQVSLGQFGHLFEHSVCAGAEDATILHCAQCFAEWKVQAGDMLYYWQLLFPQVAGMRVVQLFCTSRSAPKKERDRLETYCIFGNRHFVTSQARTLIVISLCVSSHQKWRPKAYCGRESCSLMIFDGWPSASAWKAFFASVEIVSKMID